MPTCGFDHRTQIIRVRRDDAVAIRGQENYGCVYDIGRRDAAKEHPGRPAKIIVKGPNLDACQGPGESRLAGAAASSTSITDPLSVGAGREP